MKRGHLVISWFRVVSPPAWTVFALTIYAIVEGLHQFTLALDAKEESRMLGQASAAAVASLTAAYALFRGIAFHPAAREEYLAWLALTPWRFPKPLPLGPVHVVAQDLVVLALFEILLLDAALEMRLLVPAIFFFVLTGCWAFWVGTTGSRTAAYEIGYALGATLWISSSFYLAAGVCLIATYVLAIRRLRQSFENFPWASYRAWRQRNRLLRSSPRKTQGAVSEFASWGYAFDVLSPKRSEKLPLRDRLMLSGLVGWFALAILSHSQVKALEPMVTMLSILCGGGYCMRQVLRYVWSHAPPISLFGRLVTGRWVIPSYDVALVPIVYYLGAIGVASFLVFPNMAWPVRYVVPAAMTLYLVLMNLACPDLDMWRLTCRARLSSWAYAAAKTEYEQL